MRKVIFITIILAFLRLSLAFAETEIKAEVDKTNITTDELCTYKLVIASSEREIPAPELPAFNGFSIVSQAQSSTVSFVKGGVKNILVYAYILAPLKTGLIKIEPAKVTINNKTYTSPGFEIEVFQGKTQPKPRPQPRLQPKSPSGIPAEPERGKITL